MKLSILGTRGIPACHGGFETFAEHLARYLVKRGHEVTVYCQSIDGSERRSDVWDGIHRIHIPAPDSPAGTIAFDLETVRHSAKTGNVILTLGYNTAIFSLIYKFYNVYQIMNMDGLEWHRQKWSAPQKAWLWMNELAGAFLANHLVADHPQIKEHLLRHTRSAKISIIPYGADQVQPAPDAGPLAFEMKSKDYILVVARPEPENSILEVVQGFSARPRECKLVVLGRFKPESNPYHDEVMKSASANVIFPGPLYDRTALAQLRLHALAYVHGHTVGGTNPSLVEALAASNPVIAHDNRFNRWVAGPAAEYFSSVSDLSDIFSRLQSDEGLLRTMQHGSVVRHAEAFTQELVLGQYEELLLKWDARLATTRTQSLLQPIPVEAEHNSYNPVGVDF